MTLNEIAAEAHANSRAHGFWDNEHLGTIPAVQYHVPSADPRDGPREITNPSIDYEKIALMHSELAEATEALRTGNLYGDHGVAEELADVIIRIGDYAGARKIDLDGSVARKLEKNRARPHMHGKLA